MAVKEEKIILIAHLILKAVSAPGFKRLNVQKIAAEANVSRAWIYKYFGSTKKDLILTAIDSLSPDFTELSKKEEEPTSKKEWVRFFLKGLEVTLMEVQLYPQVYRFILNSMIQQNEFSERLRHHEELFIEHKVVPYLRQVFGYGLADARNFAQVLMGIRFGLALSWLREPQKTEAKRKKIIQHIKKYIFAHIKEQ